jgi:DNA helicase HerA-like ATPase
MEEDFSGTIISNEETPDTTKYYFVIKKGFPKKGQYVQTEIEGGEAIGYISEIIKFNRYFQKPEAVAEFGQIKNIREAFPVDSWDYLIAQVKILGFYKNGKFERVLFPPKPGSTVVSAEDEKLRVFLGFNDEGLNLGKIEHHNVDAKVSLTKLLQKHFAILAMSGSGKSHLASVLLEELLDRKREDGRVAVVVIDIHGEYIGFANDPKYGPKTKIIEAKDIRIPLRKLSPEMLLEWMRGIKGDVQGEALKSAYFSALKKAGKGNPFGLKTLYQEVMTSTEKEPTKNALRRAIFELRRQKIISKNTQKPNLNEDIKPGELLILDFSSIDSQRKKQIAVAIIAKKLFSLRRKEKIPPFLLLIEEAHNFAKEKAEASEAISKPIIETIAREGRKFGASLGLITQRPVNLSTTALSQCNTHIILRVTNPNDLDHIQQSSEGIDSRVVSMITSLKIGEGIIVGEAVNYPIFVKFRNRKSQKRERGIPLHTQAIEFERKKEKREKGVEAFI